MADQLERSGDKAIVDEDYERAVGLYTQALDLEPGNASLYVSRAAAYIKLEAYTDAVADANRAINLDPGLSKAHLRRGTACFYLEEYQTAKAAFEAGAAIDPNNSQLKMWIRKCDAELIEEAAADDEEAADPRFAAAAATSESPVDSGKQLAVDAQPAAEDRQNGATHSVEPAPESSAPVVPDPPVVPPIFRHEWYQTPTHTVVTIFAKNVKGDQLTVDFGEQVLSVVIARPDEESYVLQLRLFGKIKTEESKYIILSTKVEIRLAKAGTTQWKGLEYDPTSALAHAPGVSVHSSQPAPKKLSKNWDKLEAEVKKAEKDEKLEGDAALNKLFQDIYKNADEDTRRAMNKSFVESNGTVLSTNWKEVGSKNVEGSPPKGMEMKKWQH